MKLSKSRYERIDAVSKILGLILLAFSIDYASKGNYYIALALFGIGGIISIVPVFIEVET
ncbi:MAG: hypothetical protein O8C64_12080 [Candidatus Methanoperedens sp.]|nr:hypothetical protein [Candidatus Methanoperedens sp.]MCZ7384891.1 hypothetical protein [Candidatus Methanoperedens sp.]MCZ7404884.1 hypothetical protein [Candidatus Methanoperedens sp.]